MQEGKTVEMESKVLPKIYNKINELIMGKEKTEEKQPITCNIETAINKMKKHLSEAQNEYWTTTINEASKGYKDKIEECYGIIEYILDAEKITIEEMDNYEAAKEIFRREYGLGELEEFIREDRVDEIRVTTTGRVYLKERGKNIRTSIVLSKEEKDRLLNVLKPYDDSGAALDISNPTLETVREDGIRLTALTMNVVDSPAFVLRKSGNIELNEQKLIELGTIDEKVWLILKVLTKGRVNRLIYGDVNTGKSTLLKLLVKEVQENLNIISIDIDTELKLTQTYPDKEIWELEVHEEDGATIDKLFITALRLSPDIIIVPEFRGMGETAIAVESCIRGHRGLITTCHYSADLATDSILNNIAFLMKKEGVEAPIELLEDRVTRAFNVIVRMEMDSKTGVRKVTKIDEVTLDEDKKPTSITLVEWVPAGDNYWGEGSWVIKNKPSKSLEDIMLKSHVSRQEIDLAFS